MNLSFLRSPRFWFAIIAVAAIVLLRMSGLGGLLSLDTLRAHRAELVAWVHANELLAAAAYVLIYIGTVAFSLPGAAFLTVTGGFLFGTLLGTILTAVGATVGATIVFLFAKALFGERAVDRLATQYPKLLEGIRGNAWSYLLVLRLVPLFPFFLVNLAAAFVRVKLPTYVLTTSVGILPGTTVYSLSGAGLGSILDQEQDFSLASVFTPTVIAALVGLAALSLAAIPVRRKLAGPSGSPPPAKMTSSGHPGNEELEKIVDDKS
jgi:uncharacterized membrane protein YdjX (TVP38/TMEM64 family)